MGEGLQQNKVFLGDESLAGILLCEISDLNTQYNHYYQIKNLQRTYPTTYDSITAIRYL